MDVSVLFVRRVNYQPNTRNPTHHDRVCVRVCECGCECVRALNWLALLDDLQQIRVSGGMVLFLSHWGDRVEKCLWAGDLPQHKPVPRPWFPNPGPRPGGFVIHGLNDRN